jgi:site-specific recombinase XerD
MKRYAQLVGIPADRAHFHCMKHSCGTHLLTRGEDLMVVKDHLGHRSIKSTMIYAQFTTRAREAAGERLREWGR